jgi:large subunit ribosomal protein L35
VPKIKTHKTTAKRFRLTGTGKIMRPKGHQSHLRRKRAKRAKLLYGRSIEVTNRGDQVHIERLVPYLK